jgi:hypothetical protein
LKRTAALIVLLLATSFTSSARAAIVYEGFYKLTQGTKQTGFFVDRRETTANGQHKITRYSAFEGGDTQTEIYVVDSNFRAVESSIATMKAGAVIHQSKATFSGGSVTMTVTDAGQTPPAPVKSTVPTDVTFDAFIGDYMKSLKGGKFVTGTKLNIVRFTDEPGISVSEVTVGPMTNVGPWKTYPINVRPRDTEQPRSYFVSDEGQLVQARISGNTGLLVSTLKEATGTFPVNTGEIQKTFGGMPQGGHPGKPAAKPAAPAAKK